MDIEDNIIEKPRSINFKSSVKQRKINCLDYPYAPACRGVMAAAKRDLRRYENYPPQNIGPDFEGISDNEQDLYRKPLLGALLKKISNLDYDTGTPKFYINN